MRNKKMIILVIVMAITVVGLLAYQNSLITRNISYTVETFNKSAQSAIHHTVRNIEKNDAITYLYSYIDTTSASRLDSIAWFIQKYIIPDWETDIHKEAYSMPNAFELIGNLLDENLKRVQIAQPYVFTLLDKNGNQLYCSPIPDGIKSINNIPFTYTKAINSPYLFSEISAINVTFPTLTKRGLINYSDTLPSMVLVLVILSIFIYTVIIIYKQRNLNEMKTDFINNITHELKTPLASITLASQMLSEEGEKLGQNKICNYSSVITEESKRLRTLVDKVLQMASYESGGLKLQLSDLNINPLIEVVCNNFSHIISNQGGNLLVNLDAQYDVALVDKVHFSNIIYNLLDNAVKYKSPDRPLEIFVHTSSPYEGAIQISIEDNGIGISRDNQRHLFERFYRVHPDGNRHDVRGYGIGLSYVKQIVDAHYGSISVQSELGVGTKMTITLQTL